MIFSKNRQKFDAEELQNERSLKNLKISPLFIKDSSRRQNCVKIQGNHSHPSKIQANHEEIVKFFQIFERFTNLSSTSVKNASRAQRTATEAVKFVLRTDPRQETSPEGKKESKEKTNTFQPSDLAQRTDSRWISEKVHEF
jgi:hypothetical protein